MATRTSKRVVAARKTVEEGKAYSLKDAVALIQKMPKTKFDETVELHFDLNIDTKASDQNVRGTVVLPHGTGKTIRVAVICQGENITKAKNAGADFAGAQDLIEKIAKDTAAIDGRLNNPGFVAKAPPEVLDESRERKTELEARKAKVDEALARLG